MHWLFDCDKGDMSTRAIELLEHVGMRVQVMDSPLVGGQFYAVSCSCRLV